MVTKIEISNKSRQKQTIVEAGLTIDVDGSIDLVASFSLKEIANFFSLQRMLDDKVAYCRIIKDGESMVFFDADNFLSVLLESRIQEVDTTTISTPEITGGTVAIDVSGSSLFEIFLDQNVLISDPVGSKNGQRIVLRIKQDSTGGHIVSFSAAWNFGIDLAGIDLSSEANSIDYLGAIYNQPSLRWDVISITRGY